MLKQVIVVRVDLDMSKGKVAVQAAHAAVSAALTAMKHYPDWFREWLDSGQKKVVLKVSSERELIDIYEKARNSGLPAVVIADAGLTELPPGTITAVGIGPAPDERIDRITGHLKTL